MGDCWTDEDYNEVLSFVEKYLWIFVQENAAIHKPEQIICNLAQLNQRELRLLQLVYFLLSESIQKSVKESTPHLLRRLAQSTDRMTAELKGSVRGNVDWNLTLKQRLRTGFSNPTAFVTRLPVKTYDLPETQALKYLLSHTNQLCLEVLGNISEPEEEENLSFESNNKWKAQIRSLYHSTSIFLRNTYLRKIEIPIKITDLMLQKVRCARNPQFKNIYRSLRLYRRLFVQEEQETLRDCFSQGVLKPLNRDTLYEVYILFVTMASLEQTGWIREHFRLIGYGKGAILHYKHDNTTLQVYYQTLPASFAQNSLYTNLLRKYKIDVSLRRPDILLEFNAETCDFKLLEVKRTQNRRYIVDSVYKVLGYLKDFEKCFTSGKMPHAILVVWEGVEPSRDTGDVVVVLNRHSYRLFLENTIIK